MKQRIVIIKSENVFDIQLIYFTDHLHCFQNETNNEISPLTISINCPRLVWSRHGAIPSNQRVGAIAPNQSN